jgi:hypothetical protein
MYARISTFEGPLDQADEQLRSVRRDLLPQCKRTPELQQKDFKIGFAWGTRGR